MTLLRHQHVQPFYEDNHWAEVDIWGLEKLILDFYLVVLEQ